MPPEDEVFKEKDSESLKRCFEEDPMEKENTNDSTDQSHPNVPKKLRHDELENIPPPRPNTPVNGYNERSPSREAASQSTIGLPVLRIEPNLGGGKGVNFPIHSKLTVIDLKDFILYSLSIPHPQQVLTFTDANGHMVNLSILPESTNLAMIPGLIDEITGRCAIVSLSVRMASGMNLTSSYPNYDDSEEYFGDFASETSDDFIDISSEATSPAADGLSSLAASLVALIPMPPGVTEKSKMLVRSLSKASTSSANAIPTLWEVYFPESGIKLVVTAIVNFSKDAKDSSDSNDLNDRNDDDNNDSAEAERERRLKSLLSDGSDSENEENDNEGVNKGFTISAPRLVISSEEAPLNPESTSSAVDSTSSPSGAFKNAPNPYCSKCKIRCRPALRFVCKCDSTFCQTHRYPDQHGCTFDHRAVGMAEIQANNPKIVKDKVENF